MKSKMRTNMQHASRGKKGIVKNNAWLVQKTAKKKKVVQKTEHKQEINMNNYNKSFKYSN